MEQHILNLIISIPGILLAFTVHEYAHAKTSHMLGDDMPYFQGRVTLNPIKHIDITGFIAILLFGFGWAKPVQVNKRAYKNYRRDDFLVSMAGPLANFITSVVLTLVKLLLIKYALKSILSNDIMRLAYEFLNYAIQINMILFFLNLIPIPNFDGYHMLRDIVPGLFRKLPMDIDKYGMVIFILCMIPIPVVGNSIFTYIVGYPAHYTQEFFLKLFFKIFM